MPTHPFLAAVNVLNGYGHIGIYSPREVIQYETNESECVALKRRGAEYVAQLLSGKTRQEQLEFWSKRTERLLSKQKQSKEK